MGSGHTPQVGPGRSRKYPLGVGDTWKDNNDVAQHIPIHPDRGCAAAGVDSCFLCPFDDCLGYETATLRKGRKKLV